MSNYRIILAGQFIFNNQRSFEMALAQFNQRVEIHFKYDVFLRSENIFDVEQNCVNIPRHVEPEITDRTWRNTVSALETVCEYAIAGSLSAIRYLLLKPFANMLLQVASVPGNWKMVKLLSIGKLNRMAINLPFSLIYWVKN